MAAYYHGGAGTDIQSDTDGLQTLYLMNPSYAGYSDAAAAAAQPGAANMMLLNSAVTSMTPVSFGHQPSPSSAAQHFVGIPPQPQASGYNLWTSAATGADDMSPPSQQAPGGGAAAGQMVMSSKYLKAAQELLDEVVSVSKGVDDGKAAAAAKSPTSVKKKEDSEGVSGGGTEDGGGGAKRSGAAPPPEMSTAERQELQMKKGKLINMLDEVEQRYRQYHQQMQVVVTSFEAVAGGGSARTYTALALRTISRQFRCLRDAIAAQVRAASRALGEAEADGGGGGGRSMGSRLRYIDHQLRQQRALQQLGMMQSSAWRPQRGLPERSVSILRAWLFEHFLHPYPKDSDKIMLAKQTGLTRSQVSNWFINARVRLWKPMVEEMYLEETKDQEGAGDEGKPGGSKGSNAGVNGVVVDSAGKVENKAARVAESGGGVHASLLELAGDHQAQPGFYEDDDEEDGGGGAAVLQQKLKKARTAEEQQQQTAAFHKILADPIIDGFSQIMSTS
uniref:Homeobox domain-containing protein n=1 Tax=Oryza brachyantha TaxID=4533 RepID=J3N682_ORYBR